MRKTHLPPHLWRTPLVEEIKTPLPATAGRYKHYRKAVKRWRFA